MGKTTSNVSLEELGKRYKSILEKTHDLPIEELGKKYKDHLEKMRIYYQNHKSEYLERNKKWRELNPEKFKESCKEASKRRNLKNRKKPDWTWPKNDEERKQRKKEQRKKHYAKNRYENWSIEKKDHVKKLRRENYLKKKLNA